MENEKRLSESNASSRRNFLKNTSLAAAGFLILPRHVLGGKGYIAPSDRLTIASIGAGGKGQSDIAAFFATGKADIAYLCDVDDRRAATTVKNFPKAKYYRDWREMLDKEGKNFDAVSVSTPDHNHAVATLAAMQLNKHVYVQKPLTHNLHESRALLDASKRYKVVTQMGNQGASNDGTRLMAEWYAAGLIGDVHTVYCWTNRPVWPQGIPWPAEKSPVPAGLDWNLWQGVAAYKDYVPKLVPFNWRGWWEYGTGALGDMGCHLVEVPFRVLNLQSAKDVQCSVGSVYVDEFQRGYFPESCPPSSHVTLTFPKTNKTKGEVTMHWMDGGIQPERPEELGPNEVFGDGGNGVLLVGTKGKMMCGTYSDNPQLLPLSKTANAKAKQLYERVPGGASGHYGQWVDACIAGYGNKEVSAPFETACPLNDALHMANLAIRSFDIRTAKADGKGFDYPGRYIKMLWDNDNMKITNFDLANQFVSRQYRDGFKLNA